MNSSTNHPFTPPKSLAITFVLVALAYYVTARLGLMVPYKEPVATLMWLPTGIAVGAIMRWGNISLPAVYAAAFLTELSLGLPFFTSVAIACTNTLAPFVAAYLLKKFNFNHSVIKQKDIVLLILVALLGMLVSATGGVLSLYHSGLTTPENISRIWFVWWMGDSIGVLLALPLVLNVGKKRMHVHAHQYYQLFAWLMMFVIGEIVISSLVPSVNKQFMLSIFLILPMLIWASMNFGIVGGSLVVISLSSIAVWFTAQGYG
ncbi:MAG: MASE1 domain-containing protein, partial [Methylotenera sp.]|nr:MASE1 domain-containing protein [Methylotenera sp.]